MDQTMSARILTVSEKLAAIEALVESYSHALTAADKLVSIEALIEHYRFARRYPDEPEFQTYVALKAVAADLRARLDRKPDVARRTLGGKIAAAVRKSDGDSDAFARALLELGRDLIGFWPVVEQALEWFDQENREKHNDGIDSVGTVDRRGRASR
jgi:hypothetical protein